MSMYTGAKRIVRTVSGSSKYFAVKVSMHQGSALSPLLFMIVMEAISREFRVTYRGSYCMLLGQSTSDVLQLFIFFQNDATILDI